MKIDLKLIGDYFDYYNEEFDVVREWVWGRLYPLDENGKRAKEKDEFRINTRGLDTILISLRTVPKSGRTVANHSSYDVKMLIGGYALADNVFYFILPLEKPLAKMLLN